MKNMTSTFAVFCMLLLTSVSYAANNVTPVDSIKVIVNDDVILQSEIDAETASVKQQASAAKRNLPDSKRLEEQVIERLIRRKVQYQRAVRTGIKIDDDALDRTVARIAQRNNLNLPAFRQVLIKEGYNYRQYRENIRSEMTISQLRQREIHRKVVVSDQEIQDFIDTNNGLTGPKKEYLLQHILVAVPEGADALLLQQAKARAEKVHQQLQQGAPFTTLAAQVSDGPKALEGGTLGWRSPDKLPGLFADALAPLKQGEITPILRSANGFHILKIAESRGAEKLLVKETLARHILVATNDVISNKAAESKIREIRQMILDGKSFDALAKEHSNDKGSALEGGKLPWFRDGQMVPEFQETAARLPLKRVSEPFRTQFGWHILEVLDRRTLDETDNLKKEQVRQAIMKRKIEEETQLWLRRLRDEAYVEIRDKKSS